MLTVAEVAERLRVSRYTVYSLVDSGQLEHFRVGNAIRVPEAALNQFINRAPTR